MKSLFLSFLAAVLALSATIVSAQTTVTDTPVTAPVGVAFTNQLGAKGSTFGWFFATTATGSSSSVVNSLPAGLSYAQTTGVLSGTPAAAGVYTITLQQSTATTGVENTFILVLTVGSSSVPPPVGTAVNLTCTPSSASTTANPGTTSLFRAVSPSTTFTSLATGLAPNCAYSDTAVSPGTTYDYYAEFTQNGETSVASNIATVSIPSSVAKTTPTVSVVASATSPVSNTAVEVTISVTGTGTVPTGSIVVVGAGFTSVASVLANGTVIITIPVNTLTTGASNFVATYTPDATSSSVYNTATGSEAVIVIPAAPSSLGGTVN